MFLHLVLENVEERRLKLRASRVAYVLRLGLQIISNVRRICFLDFQKT